MVEGIRQDLDAMKAGCGRPAGEVFTDIRWVRVHGSLGGWTPAMAIGLCDRAGRSRTTSPLPGACR